MSDWITCAERLPVTHSVNDLDDAYIESDPVLVWVSGGIAPAGNAYDGHMDVMFIQDIGNNDPCWYDGNDIYLDMPKITHWRPLPDKPQGAI